ncbi:hypothetical protein Tco_0632693 [Tanacetum coccineum]
MRFSLPCDVDGQGAWDTELDTGKIHSLHDRIVACDFGTSEIHIDLTMLEEEKEFDAMLEGLVEKVEEVGSSNRELVKMGKASSNKSHNVNKITPPLQLKIEEIRIQSPPFQPPPALNHPPIPKRKRRMSRSIGSKV